MYPVGSIWDPLAGLGQAQLKRHPHRVEIGIFSNLCDSIGRSASGVRKKGPLPPTGSDPIMASDIQTQTSLFPDCPEISQTIRFPLEHL
jgi:hypothetical protein